MVAISQVQFLDKVMVIFTGAVVEVPQLQLIFQVVGFPVVAQRLFPWSSLFS